MSIVAALKNVPIFSGLSDDVVRELARIGEIVSLPSDTIVYHQGDTPDSMYIITQGDVSVFIVDDKDEPIHLKKLKSGSSFGELAMLDGKPRSASISCLTPCTFFVLGHAEFMQLIQSAPGDVLPIIFSTLTAQVRNSTEIVAKEATEKHAIRSEAEDEQNRLLAKMATTSSVPDDSADENAKELMIEIDEERQADQVAEITESDYFRELQGRARSMRRHSRHTDEDDA